MKRIVVVGSTGQLGADLVRVLAGGPYQVLPLSHEQIECTSEDSVRRMLTAQNPDVVINCAAYARVEDCEDHEAEAFRVNSRGALNVARACKEIDALCVYISTDYVFDGEKGEPYTEDDVPRPINVYGVTKLAGEFFVRQACRKWLIVRIASLFGRAGPQGKGGNFVEAILARAKAREPLRVVNDIVMSPTYALDASRALETLIERESTGIVHLTNSGSCSWYEFTCKVLELAHRARDVRAILSSEYPMKARRPGNSILSHRRANLTLRSWQEALQAYLGEKGHLPNAEPRPAPL